MPADWEIVPPPVAVAFGPELGWNPRREGQKKDHTCTICHGVDRPGGRIYCAGCTRYSGYDHVLERQRRLSRKPGATRKQPIQHVPRVRLSRKEVARYSRTPEGREWLARLGREVIEDEQAETPAQSDAPTDR